MTREEAIKMLTAKVECMLRETSGSVEECNSHRCGECNLCYEQGDMGEQVEYLQMAIKALEEPSWISCSERMPEFEIPVWITVKKERTTRRPNVYLASREKRSRFFEEHWCTEEFSRFNYESVTAWMLVEPYKGGEEE